MVQAIYPWQLQQWQQLCQMLASDRLPHALMFTGENTGQSEFALQFAKKLLCRSQLNATEPACSQCESCRWFDQTAHPDFKFLQAENQDSLKVDALRELNAWLDLSAEAQMKVAVLAPVENLTLAAANAFLKKLEEPLPGRLLILLSYDPASVLATIRSRCQLLNFALPDKTQAIEWLEQQGVNVAEAEQMLILDSNPLRLLQCLQDSTYLEAQQALEAFLAQEMNRDELIQKLDKADLKKLLSLLWLENTRQMIKAIAEKHLPKLKPLLAMNDFIKTCYHAQKQSLNLNEMLLKQNLYHWLEII